MRTAPRLAATVVSLLLPLALLASPSYAAEPRHFDVVADELPAGPAPRVAYVDSGELVRPDGTTSGVLGVQTYAPVRVRGGYLVGVQTQRAGNGFYADTVFVPDHGKKRRVLRQSWASTTSYAPGRTTVSSDGRLMAMFTGGYDPDHVGVAVKRVSDGRTLVRRRDFDGEVLAFQGRRVLVLRDAPNARSRPHLVWWNVDTNRMVRILTAPSSRLSEQWTGGMDYWFGGAAAANLSTHQVALPSGSREVVRPLPGHRGRTWRTAPGEVVQSWSPDDRLVVTAIDAGPYKYGGELPQTATVRIRRAATGAVVGEFRGLVGVDTEFHRSPVWEDSDSFVTSAWSEYVPDDDHPALAGRREIRCTVSTLSCVAVLPDVEPGDYRTTAMWAVRRSS